MRVVVTGAGGQLGLDLLDAFADCDVRGLTRADLDVADEEAVRVAVSGHRPDVVVHAAAWTDVDACERHPARADLVNGVSAGWIAGACREVGAAMVYVSTDYVFDGRGGRGATPQPYTEDHPVAPVNAYGRSKALGEQLVRRTLDEHYIVRTAWVSGARGSNFVSTMLRVGREQGTARVVDDQVGSPTSARDLAVAIRELSTSGTFGTWHRTNTGTCTWLELAAAVFAYVGLEVDLQPIGSGELGRPACRPAYSVLSNERAESVGLLHLPHWRAAVGALLDEMGGRTDGVTGSGRERTGGGDGNGRPDLLRDLTVR